jgi:hypothetical protein
MSFSIRLRFDEFDQIWQLDRFLPAGNANWSDLPIRQCTLAKQSQLVTKPEYKSKKTTHFRLAITILDFLLLLLCLLNETNEKLRKPCINESTLPIVAFSHWSKAGQARNLADADWLQVGHTGKCKLGPRVFGKWRHTWTKLRVSLIIPKLTLLWSGNYPTLINVWLFVFEK